MKHFKFIVILFFIYYPQAFSNNPNVMSLNNLLAEREVSGKVTDDKGNALGGVRVGLKGTNKATVTSDEGAFKLSVPSTGGVLVFSYIGFVTREVLLSSLLVYQIKMTEDNKSLDEIVVIGYGTTTRKDLTGSVGSAKVEDMLKAPVVSFEDALAGRVAGVQVTTSDGQPGTMSDIVIRGGNSITQSNSPLYVIDGFPLEDPDNNAINPDDIESIEILKDASSTAIYGARGANGVIIITTKQGKIGEPVITYNNWLAIQQNANTVPVMNAYEFVKYQYDLSPVSASQYYFQNGKTLESYKDVKGIDWQRRALQNAFSQNHSISVRGGTAATKYSISGSYLDQEGIVINGGYKRYQGRFQIDQRVRKNLKIGLNTNYSYTIKNGQIANQTADGAIASSTGNTSSYLMFSTWGYRPISGSGNMDDLIDNPFDEDIESTIDQRVNPVINAKNAYNYTFTRNLLASGFLEYSFLKYLKFKVSGGITDIASRSERFNNSNTSAGNPKTTYGSVYGINGNVLNSSTRSLLNENLVTFNRTFNRKHRIDAVAGFTLQRNAREANGYSSILLPNESLGIKGLAQGTVSSKNYSGSYSTLVSFLGRVNYSLSSKYLFTFSFRRDGSSKFAPENRWGYFPSGAFAWNVGNEKLVKKLGFISSAKLRTSYGITGNNRVSDFSYLGVLEQGITSNSGNTTSGYYFNGEHIYGTIPTRVGNDKLKWERTANLDLGLDVGLFKERINFTAEYYHKRTSDLLLDASLATSSGYLNGYKNIGVVVNKGFEFTVNTVNINSKDFNWNSSFNIAFNRNKIVELNEGEQSITTRITSWSSDFNNSFPYIALIGQNVAMFYGYVSDGLYQLSDFDKLPNGNYRLKANVIDNGSSAVQPGHTKYKDLNGDGIIDANDQTIIGNPNPVHIGGFTNNFRYKRFDLNVFFQWSYGNDILNANRIIFEGADARRNLNMFASYQDRWSIDNQQSQKPIAGGYGPNVYSDRPIEDGSFIRLKTVSFGYTLPVLSKKWGIKTIRINTSAQNLFTWTKYTGLDPEVSVRNSALTPGFDWSAYPRARTFSLGLNVTF